MNFQQGMDLSQLIGTTKIKAKLKLRENENGASELQLRKKGSKCDILISPLLQKLAR